MPAEAPADQPPSVSPRLVPIADVARLLGRSVATVERRDAAGTLAAPGGSAGPSGGSWKSYKPGSADRRRMESCRHAASGSRCGLRSSEVGDRFAFQGGNMTSGLTDTDPPARLLTPGEVAVILRTTDATVRRLCRTGGLVNGRKVRLGAPVVRTRFKIPEAAPGLTHLEVVNLLEFTESRCPKSDYF